MLTPPVAAPFQAYYPTGASRVTQAILPNVPRTHGVSLCAHCLFCGPVLRNFVQRNVLDIGFQQLLFFMSAAIGR